MTRPLALVLLGLWACGSSGAGPVEDGCQDPLVTDAEAFRGLAGKLASPEAIAFRYGGGCAAASLPGPDPAPHLCEREHFELEVQPGVFFGYELGSHDLDKDDYSMTDGQVAYLPDADAPEDGAAGLAHFTQVIMGQGVFGAQAQKTWGYYGGLEDHAALPHPVAMARGYDTWSEDALVIYQDGRVAGAGTFTGNTELSFAFPAGKQPVAVALTLNNEVALFVVWDTEAHRSQLAVVALGSGVDFWGDWKHLYPGLSSYGMYTFAKILGYVDLPVVAATEISASSDFHKCADLPYACWLADHRQYGELDLADEATRQTFVGDSFVDGTNIGAYARAGYAAIIAPGEKKLVLIDLAPLLGGIGAQYFSTRERFDATANVGQAPEQWPYAFSAHPELAPTVAQVIDLEHRPTAVKASPLGGELLVATIEGTLHVLDVGTLAGRHASSGDAPRELTQVAVGANVTSIAHMKHGDSDTPGAPREAYLVLSRAQRRLDWVRVEGGGATVERTLRDDRLVDPIAVEDADNHGTESFVLSIADHQGRVVRNYRYGPVTYYTNGGERFDMCGPDFEHAGALELPGQPFAVSVNNTP